MKKKIFFGLIIFLVIILTNYINIYAFSVDDMNGSGTTASADTAIGKVDNLSQDSIKVISTIGSIISVVALIALGIKYMMGSVEEKAEYKKTFLPYVIGASIVFAASTIASIIYNLAIKI